MRIGLSIRSNYSTKNPRSGAQNMIERARAARDAGVDTLFVGDHHVTRQAYYQNVPMLGRLLAEWNDNPAGALFLLPLWNPVLLAEQVGTLAAIAPGRFILQCALGGEPAMSAGLGVDHARRVGMFEAGLELMRELWRGEQVSEERYWGIRNARISPVPSEPVEVWIGAGAPPAVRRAARMGDAWLASPSYTVSEAAEAAERYHLACAEFGRTPLATAIRQDVCISATSQAAQDAVASTLARGYRGFNPEALLVGSVAQAVDRFGALAEVGYTDVILRNISQDQSVAVRTIQHLSEVIEQLHG